MARMSRLALVATQDDSNISKREVLEKAYKIVIKQLLLAGEQIKELNDLKRKYEDELGLISTN